MEWDAQLIRLSTVAPPGPPTSSSPAPIPGNGRAGRGEGGGAGEIVSGGDEMGIGENEDEIVEMEMERGMGDEGLVELWGKETWSEKVAKWLFCGDDRNTRRVYVRGRLVFER